MCLHYLVKVIARVLSPYITNTPCFVIANVDELCQRIVDEWVRLDQRIIKGALKEWRKRLRACAAAEGGQFEHEL